MTTTTPLMSATRRLLTASAFIAALPLVPLANAASDSWNVDANGNWIDAANWQTNTTVPGSGETATFGNVVLTANRTVTVDTNRAISSIIFNNTNTGAFGYTLSGGSFQLANAGAISVTGATTGSKSENISSSIQFQGATATIENTSSGAAHSLNITGALTTATTTTLTLNATNGATNTVQNTISGNIGIIKTGSGTWSIQYGNNTFNGGIEVKGGNLELYNSITAGGSGTITLNGGNLALTKNISNNNTFETNSYANAVSVLQNAEIDTYRQNSGGGSGKNQSVSSLSVASGVTLTRRGWDSYGLAVTNGTTIGGNVTFVNNAFGATTTGGRPTASSTANSASQVASGSTLLLNTLTVADSVATNSLSIATFNGNQSFDNAYISGAVTDNATDATKRLGITKTGTNILTLAGANTYTGDTTVSAGTFLLKDTGSLTFKIGANGVSNKVTGAGTAVFEGSFNFNLSGADLTTGNSWNIVDVGTLSESFAGSFAINGFTNSSGVWTNGSGLTFTQSTGLLTYSAIPEPATYTAIFGGLALVGTIIRRRHRASA